MDLRKVNKSQNLFKGRKIKAGFVVLQPGEEVGEHTTKNREEFIFIINGVAEISVKQPDGGWRHIRKKAVELYYVGRNCLHNVKNIGYETLRYIYIVT